MNKRTIEIIEEVSSQGVWTWLELDNNSNSLYLEFKNFKLLDDYNFNLNQPNLLDNNLNNVEDSITNSINYNGDLVIRFGNNLFFEVFYNNFDDLSFLNMDKPIFNELFYSNKMFSDLNNPYFYTEFSKKLSKLKFQDYDLLDDLDCRFKFNNILVNNDLVNNDNSHYDFLLVLDCDDVAIAVGCDFIHTFNDAESLNDDDIKRLSNKWVLYYLDYWDKKGTDEEYKDDLLCEENPFVSYKI